MLPAIASNMARRKRLFCMIKPTLSDFLEVLFPNDFRRSIGERADGSLARMSCVGARLPRHFVHLCVEGPARPWIAPLIASSQAEYIQHRGRRGVLEFGRQRDD